MSAAGKYGMRLFPDLVRVAAGIHFGSGPFPAPMHAFFYPGTVWFVLYAGFQIPQYMGKAFLMICSIIIKGNIMVMDKDPLIVFCKPVPFTPSCPFFSRAKYRAFPPVLHRHIPGSSFRFPWHLYNLYA